MRSKHRRWRVDLAHEKVVDLRLHRSACSSLPAPRSIRLREHAAAGARLAGEDALARLVVAVERNAADGHFELLELLVHLRRFDEVGVRQAAVDFRSLFVLGREERFELFKLSMRTVASSRSLSAR